MARSEQRIAKYARREGIPAATARRKLCALAHERRVDRAKRGERPMPKERR